MSTARRIHPKVIARIGNKPCVVCRLEGWTEVDHIVPVARGGSADETNLQPLCHFCNAHKRHVLSNTDLTAWVLKSGLHHFVSGTFRADTRRINSYDAPNQTEWFTQRPERLARAEELFMSFVDKHAGTGA
jgi:hypothetical protein